MVYNTLNKLKWTGRLNECRVTFIHRGAANDLKTVSGEYITEVRKTYFCYKSGDKETFIPYHRVVRIRMGRKTIWKRKTKRNINAAQVKAPKRR